MKLFVEAKPGAKQVRIERLDPIHYKIWVKAPAKDGKANEAVIEVLSAYLKKPKSHFTLIRGAKARQKTIELCE